MSYRYLQSTTYRVNGHLFSPRTELLLAVVTEMEVEWQPIGHSEGREDGDGVSGVRASTASEWEGLLQHSNTKPEEEEKHEFKILPYMYQYTE